MAKKLLLVGSDDTWSIENHYLKYLKSYEDWEVSMFSVHHFYQAHFTFKDRLFRRLFPNVNPFYTAFNQALLENIQYAKPDVILIFKGMELYPETLQKIRNLGIKCCNYNPDHPFVIVSRGSGNNNIQQAVPLYDLHFCYSKELIQTIENQYKIQCAYLPFGFELSEEQYHEAAKTEETNRVCFIGNPDNDRIAAIKAFLNAGLEVDVFGYHWDKAFSGKLRPGLMIHGVISGMDFWQRVRSYRVQLNIFRQHNIGSHNMRTFEVPAVGGIMLAPDSPEHRAFFEADSEVFLYQSEAEMLDKARFLLALSKEKAGQIRTKARQRSINEDYSYAARAAKVRQELNLLIRN